MDLDTPLGDRCGREVIAVPGATAAIVDGQTEGVHIARLERLSPGVEGKLAGSGPVEGSGALGLSVIPIGYHQEVPAGALEDDVAGVVVELQVPGRNRLVIGEVLGIEGKGDRSGTAL